MISTTAPHRHSPGWLTGPDRPVFLIRAGSVIERAQVEAELSGSYGAGRVFAFELAAAFNGGVNALLVDDPGREDLLAIGAREMDADGDPLTDAEKALLAGARDVLGQHWPEYRALRTRMAMRREIAPIVALRRFLVGWEGIDVPFSRGPDGLVPEAVLGRVDPLQMLDAGHAAYGLLYPDEEKLEGNSARPSPSDAAPKASASGDTSKAAGTSTGASGKRTPGSRSRRKSSPL